MNIQLNFRLSKDRRKKVYEQIKESCKCDFGYYVMTVLSALIVALGLLINSSATVIGGMLLAPLFWHILGLGLSISKGQISRFKFHILSLLKAMALAIFLTMILFWFLPARQEAGSEIIARSNPNILHLLIAFLSGIAGAIAMSWPGISTSIIGVLIAAALIPPLATIGYGLTSGDLNLAGGATLLFIANLVAIVFASSLTFFAMGFKPAYSEKAQDFMQKDLKWSIVLLILVGLPLTWSFYKANQEIKNEGIIEKVLEANIPDLKSDDIKSIDIVSNNDIDEVTATLFTDQVVYPAQKEQMERDMEYWIKKNIDLSITIIATEEIN